MKDKLKLKKLRDKLKKLADELLKQIAELDNLLEGEGPKNSAEDDDGSNPPGQPQTPP